MPYILFIYRATSSLLCMLAPYFVIYAPLITLLMKRKVFEKPFG